jgi:hypothetical protein
LLSSPARGAVAAETAPCSIAAVWVFGLGLDRDKLGLIEVPIEAEETVALPTGGSIPTCSVALNAGFSVAARLVGVTVGHTEGAGAADVAVDTLLSKPAIGAITTSAPDHSSLAFLGGWLGLDQLAVVLDEVSVHLGKFRATFLAGRSIFASGVTQDAVLSVTARHSGRAVGLARGAGASNSKAVR